MISEMENVNTLIDSNLQDIVGITPENLKLTQDFILNEMEHFIDLSKSKEVDNTIGLEKSTSNLGNIIFLKTIFQCLLIFSKHYQ